MVIQEMTTSECQSALARTRLGRLACANDNQPYIVPMYFVYEDPYLYGFTTPGLKVEYLRSNPHVCVELDEVEDVDRWTSILVFGVYEELADAPEGEQASQRGREPSRSARCPGGMGFAGRDRLHALELLQKQAGWWEVGCASRPPRGPEDPVTAIFFRIRIARITGRRATPGPAPQPGRCSGPRSSAS